MTTLDPRTKGKLLTSFLLSYCPHVKVSLHHRKLCSICFLQHINIIILCGAWWLSGKFGALHPEVAGSNPTLAATLGPWTSPSLIVACSASACQLRHSIYAVVGNASQL